MSNGANPVRRVPGRVSITPPEDGSRRLANLLTITIALVIVTALSGLLYLFLAGVINPPAPRTALEARLGVIETYIAQNPQNGKLWADYVTANSVLGRYDEAEAVWIEAGEELAELPDERIQADLAWAQSLMVQERFEEAIAQADSVIKNDPQAVLALGKKNPSMLAMGIVETGMLAPAHVVRGNSLVALARWEEAAAAYTSALELDPRAADVLIYRAGAYLEVGEKEKAREDAEQALRFLPDDARALAILEELGVTP